MNNKDTYITDGINKWVNNEIKNRFNNSPCRIPLKNNDGIIIEYSLVDKKNFNIIRNYEWTLSDNGYAEAIIDGYHIFMHDYVFLLEKKRKIVKNNIYKYRNRK